MKLQVCLVHLLVFGSAATAFSQTTPTREVFVGYSFLREEFAFNRHGWVASYGENINQWLGVKTEVSGNYTGSSEPFLDGHVHSILAGPHFVFTRRSSITPWSHFLLGVTLTNNNRFIFPGGPFSGLQPVSIPTTDANFAMQPGGGIDYWLGSKVGIRLGGDYRRVFRGLRRDLDSFRLQGGVVFRLGSR